MKKMIETMMTEMKRLTKSDLAIYVMAGMSTAPVNANTSAEYVAGEETTKLRTVTMEIMTEKEEGLKTEEEMKDERAEKETDEKE